jgi:hypothetical protein
MKTLTPEQISTRFVTYVFKHKPDVLHVRRVLPWLGFVVGGIERIAVDWRPLNMRQFWFKTADGRQWKVRYQHPNKLPPRGGIEILEMLARNMDSVPVVTIRSLAEAEAFYNRPSLAVSPRLRVAA